MTPTELSIAADIFLVLGAGGLAVYCYVLSGRIRKLTDTEGGVGGAIAGLSERVEGMTEALARAETMAHSSTVSLSDLTSRADGVAQRLELLVASMHDLPEAREDHTSPPRAEAEVSPSSVFHSVRLAEARG